jgi:hypothetical protein
MLTNFFLFSMEDMLRQAVDNLGEIYWKFHAEQNEVSKLLKGKDNKERLYIAFESILSFGETSFRHEMCFEKLKTLLAVLEGMAEYLPKQCETKKQVVSLIRRLLENEKLKKSLFSRSPHYSMLADYLKKLEP